MSQPKTRRHQDKPDKMSFFAQKKGAALAKQADTAGHQDGADHSGGSSPRSEADSLHDGEPLTAAFLKRALDEQSRRLVATWQSSVAELKRDLQDIGSRTTHVEAKMEDLVDAHNASTEDLKSLTDQIQKCEAKLMDLEDRSRRSNIRLRGIPETVLPADLPSYVHSFFKLLTPEIPTDMLLLDRLHRVPKPQHIATSLPRDVLLKAHYFHVKDLLMRRSRTKWNYHRSTNSRRRHTPPASMEPNHHRRHASPKTTETSGQGLAHRRLRPYRKYTRFGGHHVPNRLTISIGFWLLIPQGSAH
ncbi:Hypothetical predicted protein [Pelobates cultripes]|uniref:Uncharacterized protein n=1 Tax=Pelobates cultripes TaxID=61616 RepID=A0AAD1WUW4_PELCU|nr:Hypothetical predicted protein [Pelobates cultripes]